MIQNILVERIQELAKSFLVHRLHDANLANDIKTKLDSLRLAVAIDAEMRRIFYDQITVPALASGGRQNIFYSRNDTDYSIKRGIASLLIGATVSLEKRSGTSKVFTRETTSWQQIFSAIQGSGVGLELLQDFPQELRFAENEALNIGVTGQTSTGYLFLHGATLKEKLDVDTEELKREIAESLPQTQLVPLVFRFAGASAEATNVNGDDEIFSLKSDRSVLLTHVSTTATLCRMSLYDEGKNLQICDRVESAGVASAYTNRYTTFYELPYPHLLRKGDRLKLRAVNGSTMSGGNASLNVNHFLTFKGFTI